ncbi:MAG: cardiolipin synthase B [Gemmatimonadales bacterium]|nr:MAG: cardiolipin synthase B [Gemmatimonadales bacterium]
MTEAAREEYRAPERALSRTAGTGRTGGNAITLQFEGPAAFEAWLEAIAGARRFIHFENYILRDDPMGRRFRDALVERARAGVPVRVLYDWVGCWATPRRYWKPFREAGVEVRAFNRPSLRDPFGLLQRDHRKLVVVDGHTCFLGGFCVGQEWAGSDTEAPWRDTGVEIRGPAAAEASRTFERVWAEMGSPVPLELQMDPADVEPVGETPVWLIDGVPWRTRIYRVTQLMAAHAVERIWITDPYFVAPRAVREALMGAARDGVDVRVLVPAHNNWPWVGSLSRSGYRQLLEAGVRIFEWEGPMIHAKTAVVDGYWCRVGSSNLNAASLLGNWELDAGVVDRELAVQVEGLFMADLASAVEIVLPWAYRPGMGFEAPGRGQADSRNESSGEPGSDRGALAPEPSAGRRGAPTAAESREAEEVLAGKGTSLLEEDPDLASRWRRWALSPAGRQTLTLADLVRAGSSLGDAIAGHRVVGREDRAVLGALTMALLVGAALAVFFPRAVAWTLGALMAWFGIVLAMRGIAQRWRARKQARALRNGEEEKARTAGIG